MSGVLPVAWRRALPPFLLVLAALLFAYRDTALGMVHIWARSDTFQHGFLVLPISLWLAWRARSRLAALEPQPMPWLLLGLAAFAFAWLLGDLATVNAVTQLALVAMIVLTVPALLGAAVARVLLFPLGFLFFAVPIGEFMTPQLMEWTADFTVAALRAVSVPVYREGQQFIVPTGHWSVIEECSGIRYLMASTMVGCLFAYLNYRTLGKRLLFVLAALVTPVFANWLRAFMIVMLGHLSSNRIAAGADHIIYGWVFFGVVIMALFMIGARWADPPWRYPAAVTPPRSEATPLGRWAVAAAGVAVLFAPPLFMAQLERSQDRSMPALEVPAQLSGWQGEAVEASDWKPSFHSPTLVLEKRYRQGERSVGLYIAYYRAQTPERKLISSVNVMAEREDLRWTVVTSGERRAPFGEATVSVRTARLRGSSNLQDTVSPRLVAWQTYWVNGKLVSDDATAKAYAALYRLLGRGDDGAAIVVYTSEQGPGDEEVLARFLAANGPLIEAQLRKARDGIGMAAAEAQDRMKE